MLRGETPANGGTKLADPKCCQNGSCGSLPETAPLAAAYVPVQQDAQPRYGAEEALTRGTLFPGLDLPFLNVLNPAHPCAGTPLGELMALDFVMRELNLYLDTHPDDREAFAFLREVIGLSEAGRREYARRYGPLVLQDLEDADAYTWTSAPWPWMPGERSGA